MSFFHITVIGALYGDTIGLMKSSSDKFFVIFFNSFNFIGAIINGRIHINWTPDRVLIENLIFYFGRILKSSSGKNENLLTAEIDCKVGGSAS